MLLFPTVIVTMTSCQPLLIKSSPLSWLATWIGITMLPSRFYVSQSLALFSSKDILPTRLPLVTHNGTSCFILIMQVISTNTLISQAKPIGVDRAV